jgi:hypothetical protein
MSNSRESGDIVNPNLKSSKDIDLIWGCKAIAEAIGRTERQTFHLLSNKAIRSARRVGGRWCCDRGALHAEFTGDSGTA